MPNQAKNKQIQAHMPHKCAQPGIQGQIKTKKTKQNKTKQKKILGKIQDGGQDGDHCW